MHVNAGRRALLHGWAGGLPRVGDLVNRFDELAQL